MTPFDEWLAQLIAPPDPQPLLTPPLPDSRPLVLPLPHLAALRVGGDDARIFLSNLLSCAGPDATSRRGALCNPKGRMLAIFGIAPEVDGGYLLTFPRELLEPVRKRLSLYVLRSKVSISDLPADHVLLGVHGDMHLPAVASLAQAGALHPHPNAVARYYGHFHPTGLQGWYEALPGDITITSPRTWRLLDIREGLPTVWATTSEQFIPQMANLDLLDAVSFTKGCYPGQEIVARMRYLGQIKRRMVHFTAGCNLTAGDSLRTATSGDAAGVVVDAIPNGPGASEGLAIVRLDVLDQPIIAATTAHSALRLSPPPYPVAELPPQFA